MFSSIILLKTEWYAGLVGEVHFGEGNCGRRYHWKVLGRGGGATGKSRIKMVWGSAKSEGDE